MPMWKDASKPDGEAVNDDGTLKDASQMDWPHSPSQEQPHFKPPQAELTDSNNKRKTAPADEDDTQKTKKAKARLSFLFG